MIEAKKVLELVKMKKEGMLIRDKDTGEFVEPKPGMTGNYEFVDPSTIDELILDEVFGDKIGQNELLVTNILSEILQKRLAPNQVKRVQEKYEEDFLAASLAKKRKTRK
jgi:hypothetical protein